MKDISKDQLIELYQTGAYRYEEHYFINCKDNKKIMQEHSVVIDKIKNGKIQKKELVKLQHIFDLVHLQVDNINIV